jgi:predicted DNA binding CopG/RHH family protein
MPEQNPAIQLDSEEQALLSDYDAGAWCSVATPEVLQSLREAARATGHKDQRINIRLSSGDLQAIRTRALQEGVPYQTLISSVLHKYVSGTLQEKPAIQAAR